MRKFIALMLVLGMSQMVFTQSRSEDPNDYVSLTVSKKCANNLFATRPCVAELLTAISLGVGYAPTPKPATIRRRTRVLRSSMIRLRAYQVRTSKLYAAQLRRETQRRKGETKEQFERRIIRELHMGRGNQQRPTQR